MAHDSGRLAEIKNGCQGVYTRINHLWLGLEDVLPTWRHKYSILYGPPAERPPLFFLGANPGGDENQQTETSWPETLDYANEEVTYRLAKFLRDIFTRADRMPLLRASAGANLLFFRSKQLAKTGDGKGWNDNPREIRLLLEKKCRREVETLIELMDLKMIFVMSKGVFDEIGPEPHVDVFEPAGRWLAARGQVNGRSCLGIMHPTGCWWKEEEKRDLSEYLRLHLKPEC